MRARRPTDWIVDLNGRHALEARVAGALDSSPSLRLLENHTHRFDRLDYTVSTSQVPAARVELKAKWQRYRGWQQHRPDVEEPDLFIIDELALRRIVVSGSHSHLVVYDHPMSRWVLFGVADLILAPKVRVARRLEGRRPTTKGKILLDLGDGRDTGSELFAAIEQMAAAIDDTDRRWSRVEPWPTPQRGAAS